MESESKHPDVQNVGAGEDLIWFDARESGVVCNNVNMEK